MYVKIVDEYVCREYGAKTNNCFNLYTTGPFYSIFLRFDV